jgi:hypothetical protein
VVGCWPAGAKGKSGDWLTGGVSQHLAVIRRVDERPCTFFFLAMLSFFSVYIISFSRSFRQLAVKYEVSTAGSSWLALDSGLVA